MNLILGINYVRTDTEILGPVRRKTLNLKLILSTGIEKIIIRLPRSSVNLNKFHFGLKIP